MKLKNLSRLTALLLAFTMLLPTVATAEITGLDILQAAYDHYIVQRIIRLDTAEERSEAMLKHSASRIAELMAHYYSHCQDEDPAALCSCYNEATGLYAYGHANHAADCPWHEAIVITPPLPDQPPLYNGNPNGAQYTADVAYNLADLQASGRAVILPEGGRATLTTTATGGQWQVYTGSEWVNIQGESASAIVVTEAKLNAIFNLTGIAQLRYYDEEQAIVLDSVEVTTQAIAGGEYLEELALTTFATRAVSVEEWTDGDDTTNTVVIDYVFYGSNKTAADSWEGDFAPNSVPNQTVTFPTVTGYLPYLDTADDAEPALSITLNTALTTDVRYTVYYKPTIVNFSVKHYQQNVENDEYTLVATDTDTGYTNSEVGTGRENEYSGFYSLLYDTTVQIAADGSTVIEIYYDRNYYLMTFDMDGGYGTEPIYARYEAGLGTVTNPTKAGYTFLGWSLDGTNIVALPTTMPAENRTYKALWQIADSAKVSIVFWGENADDEEYSYLHTSEIYAKPGTTLTFDEDNTALVCALTVHTHSDECGDIDCDIEVHEHTTTCYTCGIEEHVHDRSCYTASGGTLSSTAEADSTWLNRLASATADENGIYTVYYYGSRYYVKIGDYYYQVTIGYRDDIDDFSYSVSCTETEHTHSDACATCGKEVHTHSDACPRECGLMEHTHSEANNCYLSYSGLDSDLWTFVKSDTVTVAADGSTVINVYYDRTTFTLTFRANSNTVATITDKWGADISDEFKEAPFSTTYNGRAWECTDEDKYGYPLQTLDRMPKFDATFTLYNQSSQTLKTIYYYLENVGANVSDTTWPTSPANFTLLKEVDTYFNYATYEEEYHEIEGFTRYSEDVSGFGSDKQKNFTNNALYLYYLRNSYTLDFNNGYEIVRSESVEYEDVLDQFASYVPAAPDSYEPGSVQFEGWYLNPDCTGEKVDLNTYEMPCSDLILYANWVPVNRTVEFYLTKENLPTDTSAGTKIGDTHPDLTVPHGTKVETVPAVPVNGDYTFVGWFYMDGDTEKAFDFANMPITKDMKVYAKWSSNVLKEYTIKYVIQGTDTEIAEATTGSALAGTTKTFYPKGGTELYDLTAEGGVNYQSGYFPTLQSHSLTIDIDGTEDNELNVFEFEYVQVEKVPYKVYYLSETAPSEDAESIFYDEVEYFLVAATKTVSDNKKAVVTENYVPVVGYLPDEYQKTLVVYANGTNPDSDGVAEENIIYFFYEVNENSNNYKVIHYIENSEGTHEYQDKKWSIYQEETKPGINGQTYTEQPITIPNYTHVEGYGTPSGIPVAGQTLELTFYYTENQVTIDYVVVGPDGCGTVVVGTGTPGVAASETVKVVTGTAQGSTPTAAENYKFVGWYTDEACTVPVEAADGTVGENNKFTPAKESDGTYVADIFYAKFVVDKAELTIKKTGMATGESAIFNVEGPGYDGLVVVPTGDTGVTLYVTCGEYTITEIGDWTWRYSIDTVTVDGETASLTSPVTLDADGTTVVVANQPDTDQWLSDESSIVNFDNPSTSN